MATMVNSGGYVDVASYVNKFLAEGNPYTTGMIEDDGRRFVGREREHGKGKIFWDAVDVLRSYINGALHNHANRNHSTDGKLKCPRVVAGQQTIG